MPPVADSETVRRDKLDALLDVAYDVSSYLRRSVQPGVRVSAALLVAASLAACGGSPGSFVSSGSVPLAQPLSREVMTGLPSQPGQYAVVDGTVGRDPQGVYHFAWRDATGAQHPASASLLRLGQAATPSLQVPAQGNPILYLRQNDSVPLINSPDDLRTPIPSGGTTGGGYYYNWYPFRGTTYSGPAYYDPPTQVIPDSGSLQGAHVSTAPPPASSRTVGLARAVSGRAGGTGSGTAATNKSGAAVGSSSSTNHGGASAAKSSSFSGGKSGSSGSSSGGSSGGSSS